MDCAVLWCFVETLQQLKPRVLSEINRSLDRRPPEVTGDLPAALISNRLCSVDFRLPVQCNLFYRRMQESVEFQRMKSKVLDGMIQCDHMMLSGSSGMNMTFGESLYMIEC